MHGSLFICSYISFFDIWIFMTLHMWLLLSHNIYKYIMRSCIMLCLMYRLIVIGTWELNYELGTFSDQITWKLMKENTLLKYWRKKAGPLDCRTFHSIWHFSHVKISLIYNFKRRVKKTNPYNPTPPPIHICIFKNCISHLRRFVITHWRASGSRTDKCLGIPPIFSKRSILGDGHLMLQAKLLTTPRES